MKERFRMLLPPLTRAEFEAMLTVRYNAASELLFRDRQIMSALERTVERVTPENLDNNMSMGLGQRLGFLIHAIGAPSEAVQAAARAVDAWHKDRTNLDARDAVIAYLNGEAGQ